MPEVNIKTRGIYSTALTKLFSDFNFSIVQPSGEISRRFKIKYAKFYPLGVVVRDREDKQGIIVQGDLQQSKLVIKALREKLFDVVIRKGSSLFDQEEMQIESGSSFFEVEFPHFSKSTLDQLRDEVVPTVKNHHQLRIFASSYLDLMENELEKFPHQRREIEEMLQKRLIFDHLKKGEAVEIDHVRPEGKIINLRGKIIKFDPQKAFLRIRRNFKGGRYDGLNLPIEEGDYALTEAREGDWIIRHSYYSKKGHPKGEYYNVNTPVEFYPDRLRYLDLHLDVIRYPEGRVRIIDREKLEALIKPGYIKKELVEKAVEIAKELTKNLSGG